MSFIPNAISAKAGMALLKTQKASPTLMFGVGIAGVVATAVLASRATLKAAPLIAAHKQLLEEISDVPNYSEEYTTKDAAKEKALLLFQTTGKLFKLYLPPLATAALSIGLLTGSHVVLNRRYAAASTAYTALDKAYRSYRDRVRDKVGEESERDLYRNVEVEKVIQVDETGKKKQVNKKVINDSDNAFSFFYTEYPGDGGRNPNWSELPEINTLFLRAAQTQFNNNLQTKGFVFLNEVLDHLGLPRTKNGQIFGWLKKPEYGDGYIDFGIFSDEGLEQLYDFTTGKIDGIWLNFNVDGNILDQI